MRQTSDHAPAFGGINSGEAVQVFSGITDERKVKEIAQAISAVVESSRIA